MVAMPTFRCTTGLIISQVAEVFAVPWQMVKPSLIRIGNQRKDITVFASTTNGSMFPMKRVITEANRAGRTMVWPMRFDEQISIRCFMPGSMT
jgi:hypothetical protein